MKKSGDQNLGQEYREAARPMATFLDINKVAVMPDRASAIPVSQQIAASSAAAAALREIHVLNALGHIPANFIPHDDLLKAQEAYHANPVYQIMQRVETSSPESSHPVEPAMQIVTFIGPEISDEHQGFRDRMKEITDSTLPSHEKALDVRVLTADALSRGMAAPEDFIALARLNLQSRKPGF